MCSLKFKNLGLPYLAVVGEYLSDPGTGHLAALATPGFNVEKSIFYKKMFFFIIFCGNTSCRCSLRRTHPRSRGGGCKTGKGENQILVRLLYVPGKRCVSCWGCWCGGGDQFAGSFHLPCCTSASYILFEVGSWILNSHPVSFCVTLVL